MYKGMCLHGEKKNGRWNPVEPAETFFMARLSSGLKSMEFGKNRTQERCFTGDDSHQISSQSVKFLLSYSGNMEMGRHRHLVHATRSPVVILASKKQNKKNLYQLISV